MIVIQVGAIRIKLITTFKLFVVLAIRKDSACPYFHNFLFLGSYEVVKVACKCYVHRLNITITWV